MLPAASAADVPEGGMLAVDVAGKSVLIARIGGQIAAVLNSCPHLGLAMTRGALTDGVLRCPWHGSRFDFCSGRNLDWVNAFMGMPVPGWTRKMLSMGKAPAPLKVLAAEERDGQIYVAAPV